MSCVCTVFFFYHRAMTPAWNRNSRILDWPAIWREDERAVSDLYPFTVRPNMNSNAVLFSLSEFTILRPDGDSLARRPMHLYLFFKTEKQNRDSLNPQRGR